MLLLARVQIYTVTHLLGIHGVPGTVLNAMRALLQANVTCGFRRPVPLAYSLKPGAQKFPGLGLMAPPPSVQSSPRSHLGHCQGNLLPSSLHLPASFASN